LGSIFVTVKDVALKHGPSILGVCLRRNIWFTW